MNYKDFFYGASEGNSQLEAIREGRVKMGLGIGIQSVDDFLRYKQGQFNMMNSHDNTGKTTWMLWYFCVLSSLHGLTWDIFSSENSIVSLKRDVMQFMQGQRLDKMSEEKFYRSVDEMNQSFNFIKTDVMYTADQILSIASSTKSTGLLIDPYNSLKSDGKNANKHLEDYDICANIRIFCKKTNKTVYVNAHLVTEAARRRYPKEHIYEGHLTPAEKADCEGGQKFANRADDFLTGHRMTQHEQRKNIFELHVRKVKETITGGAQTPRDKPIEFVFDNYKGFLVNGVNPLKIEEKQTDLKTSLNGFKNDNNFEF